MAGDVAIIQDADLEYDPAEIPRVIQPILDGRADAVFGSRFLSGDYRRVLYYWHSLGNGVLTWLANMLCDLNLTDMETCYKAVRADILRQTPLHCRDFAIEPELTVRLAQWGIRLYEVPVSYAGRTYVEGKKIGWRDGLKALWTMVRCRFLDTRFTTHDGYSILVAVRKPAAFNRWMYRQIAPYVGRLGARGRLRDRQPDRAAARPRPAGRQRLRPVLRRDDRSPVRPPGELPSGADGPDPGRGL